MHSPVVAVATPVALGQKSGGKSGAFFGAMPALADGMAHPTTMRRDAAICDSEGFILLGGSVARPAGTNAFGIGKQ